MKKAFNILQKAVTVSLLRRVCSLLGCSLVFGLAAFGQVSTADITGTVTDPTGALLPQAIVRIENTSTHEVRTFKTAQDGQYTVTALQPGQYVITITDTGFRTFTTSAVRVVGGDRLRVDASLRVGNTSESTEVTAVASSLQTDSTNVGSTVTQAAAQDVPLNGRNFVALVQVSAGVNAGSPSSITNSGRLNDRRLSSAVSANGQDETSNNQLIDGMDNQTRWNQQIEVRPSVDAIEEVRTDINLYTAEIGRAAGAAINIVTKSGSNSFHGSVYEFFRNDVTDARNYFAAASFLSRKPELRQNQFGGSIGGPIRKDKTFFFADLEGYRRIDGNGSVYVSSVPSQFEHDHPGNLTDICGADLSASADPTAVGYFKLYPAPTPGYGTQASCVGGVSTIPQNNFLYNPSLVQNQTLGDAKIDHHFSQKDTLTGRYSYNHVSTLTPGAFPAGPGGVQNSGFQAQPAPGNSILGAHQVELSYLHIFTPSLVMQLETGMTYFYTNATPFNFGSNLNDKAPYLIPNANNCFQCSGLALITLQGSYAPMGDPNQQPRIQSEINHQQAGAFTWTHGAHTFKFGGSFIRRNDSTVQSAQARGFLQFTGAGVASLTNFFKGTPYTYQRNNVLTKPYIRSDEISAYAQDDWHASSHLTLNLGIRYDIFTTANEKYGNLANFDLASMRMVTSATGGVRTSYVNLAPRIGFAFTLKPSTVVRGGYGLTFYPGDTQGAWYPANAPFQYASGKVSSTGKMDVAGIVAPTQQSTAPSSLSGVITVKPFDFREEYIHQFNLLLQHEVSGNVFTIGYVGELGRHMQSTLPNIDLPAPTGPSPAGTPAPAFLYATSLPKVNTISYIGFGASSSYHSLQISLERRLARGFTANLNYTLAHGLNNIINTIDGDAASFYPSKPLYDYGNSVLDIRHRIAGTFTYQVPSPGGTGFARALLGQWQINGLGFWQTGLPFTVTASTTHNGLAQVNLPGVTLDRPNYAGSGAYAKSKSVTQWFNPSAFYLQPLGVAGNEGRNQFHGPHLRRGDLSLIKRVPVGKEMNLQFRVECFNITNTPNFDLPNFAISSYSATPDASGRYVATTSGGFGTITSTAVGYSGRQWQFAMKAQF